MSRFGDYIRGVRTEKGITLTRVAEDMGISKAFLSQMENGVRPMPSHRMEKWCEILREPLEIAVQKQNEDNIPPSILAELEELRRRYQQETQISNTISTGS